MRTQQTTIDPAFAALSGFPEIDFPENLKAALKGGRRMSAVLREVVALRRGPGKLTPNEYFYYRLWDPDLPMAAKRRFVGKQAQHPMHMACNQVEWYAAAADKLLFHALMRCAGLPVPELLAIVSGDRTVANAEVLAGEEPAAAFLRRRENYPLFAKPVWGKYSLAALNAEALDAAADAVILRGEGRRPIADIAGEIAGQQSGCLIQRRLAPHADLAARFGPALWSARLIVLLTPAGPVLHRTVAKIATGDNPADNFWRRGNMLGAVDPATGQIVRSVSGTGTSMVIDPPHPDTGAALRGTALPDWAEVTGLTLAAARQFPGIRTQSWDVALTDRGPVLLEVNFGGDLNLPQLAHGEGMLDDAYAAHLRRCGYRL